MSAEFRRKLRAAMDECAQAGVHPVLYNPLASRIFRFIGFPVRPPHFMGRVGFVIYSIAWFAPLFGYVMYMGQWQYMGMSIWLACVISVACGALWGACLSLWLGREREAHGLSRWDDL